ncbi:MAG: flavodoxin [Candidatus Moraniibacteriota bacterium]
MKILVVYYSRSGYTRKVALELAKELNADLEEIVDKNPRKGFKGYLKSGKEAMKQELAEIEKIIQRPEHYDLIIVGTPVWMGTMASAIRTYIKNNKKDFKKVAFFTTQGSSKEQRVFKDMQKSCGQPPMEKLIIATKEAAKGNFINKIRDFAKKLK